MCASEWLIHNFSYCVLVRLFCSLEEFMWHWFYFFLKCFEKFTVVWGWSFLKGKVFNCQLNFFNRQCYLIVLFLISVLVSCIFQESCLFYLKLKFIAIRLKYPLIFLILFFFSSLMLVICVFYFCLEQFCKEFIDFISLCKEVILTYWIYSKSSFYLIKFCFHLYYFSIYFH